MNTSAYHYTQCGLDNVWLQNGFVFHDTPYGRGVSIENVEELHETIALALTEKPTELTGAEFRFLRSELGMSQKRLGELLGKDAQSVARWEKEDTNKKEADFLIRHIYKQTKMSCHQSYVEMVDHLNRLDKDEYKLEFERGDSEWHKAKAA